MPKRSEQAAARRGADAGRKNKPRGANPYPESDVRHETWDAAYRSTQAEQGR